MQIRETLQIFTPAMISRKLCFRTFLYIGKTNRVTALITLFPFNPELLVTYHFNLHATSLTPLFLISYTFPSSQHKVKE